MNFILTKLHAPKYKVKAWRKIAVLKPLLICLLLVFIFTGRATSQPAHNEISVSYGVLSSTEVMRNGAIDIFVPVFTFGFFTSETTNTKVTGPLLFSWRYIPKSRWGFGILTGFIKGSYDQTTTSVLGKSKTVFHNKYSAFTIAPEIDFRYIQKEKFTMYSSATLGSTFMSEEIDGSEVKTTYFDVHLSLIGLRYGQKLGAFAELGFGFKGLINFGINLKL